MAGLFDTLQLGARSLATYRQAINTSGHNLANVHTPGYTRQRVAIESVSTQTDPLGEAGAGSEAVRIVRLHNVFLDRQIQSEASVEGSLETRDELLRQALTSLHETLDRDSTGNSAGGGLSGALSDFFNSLQSLSTNPSSISERQVVLQKAQALATRFNQIDSGLARIEASINDGLTAGVEQVNALLSEIAEMNETIATQETATGATANNLRDTRDLKVQELAKLVKIETAEQPNGALNIVIGGRLAVDGPAVSATLETFDPGDGRLLLRGVGDTQPLEIPGGSLDAAINVRDGELLSLRNSVNDLAALLISEVNQAHASGFSLTGATGANFFAGSNAGDIKVESALLGNPALLQASGTQGNSGDNVVVVALAQLGAKAHAALNGASFSGKYAQTIAWLGQEVAQSKSELANQRVMQAYLGKQRDAISGVSIDEEMSNLVMFQKAFQASARLISMTDEMLATIIQM